MENFFDSINEMIDRTEDQFTDEDSAKEYLLKKIEEKYNQPFHIAEEGSYIANPVKDVYSCIVSPKGNNTQQAVARVDSEGELEDNYHIYYFKNAAEKETIDLLENKSYIVEQTVALDAPASAKLWLSQTSLSDYLKESNAYNAVTIQLESGLSNEEYAEHIEDILNTLSVLKIGFELQCWTSNTHLFYYDYTKKGSNPLSYERILEKVEQYIRNDGYIKQYQDKKTMTK